jgi:hypothetical protein
MIKSHVLICPLFMRSGYPHDLYKRQQQRNFVKDQALYFAANNQKSAPMVVITRRINGSSLIFQSVNSGFIKRR